MIQEVSAYMAEVEKKAGIEEGTVKILPLIETALGVEKSFEIASADKRVIGIFLGGEDFTADMHCKRTKRRTGNLLCKNKTGACSKSLWN